MPRLSPSLTPRTRPPVTRRIGAEDLRAELVYWLIAVAIVAFAATLNILFFWGIFALATVPAFL